ncbi:MAG: hypothetical protein A2589_02220 [Candidatus Vogelbacteria bacterium RIFOXYD1_FULL_46_19]|uniref:NodB homology domain-containing protein n=1 Tax=Candidatus Vogelbacteria bacterium RIFOXYD1_FULL_46_19 TaxID=1802439 RepID=A0A1G2QI55_9BACT|nr:MAG: hypothetical protein A2589_02220 [Candidatus Vogelbacteria bacterium RIFOXYD1_FULL_46_19]
MFKTKFIITVDTEADNQWARPSGEKVDNIYLLPRFQELCQRFGLPPTYLVTYEVAADSRSVSLLRSFQDEGAEIGAHLHPWTTPPFILDRDYERIAHRFPHELSDSELKDKVAALTQIVAKNFGQPVSFRAGRWGFDDRVAKEIVRQGYLIDCSVTPKISWRTTRGDPNKEGGPDYSRESLYPYDREGILEVPLTVVSTNLLIKENGLFLKLYNQWLEGFIKRVFNKLIFRIRPLRIFPETTKRDLESIVKSAIHNKLPVIQFMIHSSELMPGGSKYAKTTDDVDRTYQKLEDLFSFVVEKGIEGVTLKEYRQKSSD